MMEDRAMGSGGQKGWAAESDAEERGVLRARIQRIAERHRRLLAASALLGFAIGVGYRLLIDPPYERDFGNFLRSGMQGVAIALTVLAAQAGFASVARTRMGATLRRLPLAAEVLVRAVVMAALLIVVGLTMQFALYSERYPLGGISRFWLTVTLPRVVLIGFGFSLLMGIVIETGRLIGSELLASVLLGTYRRPTRERLIVMYLDLAHSTRLAESMGEERVHDLITRFFFDIDEPISDFGGRVHAYVGDEVIVSWPVSDDPAQNARCVACFFAIERKIASLASDYEAEFGAAPGFRAGLHAGTVIVSECGDAKRQLAFFGDTMNVGARLCEYCKTINRRLVVSGDALRLMTIRPGLVIGDGERVAVRGRQERVEVHVIEPQT
jgi:class 3 adenylate cyclase